MEKYIRMSGRIQGDFLMIETRNSFQGKGEYKNTGMPCRGKFLQKVGEAVSNVQIYQL